MKETRKNDADVPAEERKDSAGERRERPATEPVDAREADRVYAAMRDLETNF